MKYFLGIALVVALFTIAYGGIIWSIERRKERKENDKLFKKGGE